MFVEINPYNPDQRKIKQVVECLKDGGVIIYPTDTVYGIGCDIFQQKAVERICAIREEKPEKAKLSFVCNDLSHIAEYAFQLDNDVFKLLKRTLPGKYTFILKASVNVPKLVRMNKKTVGIRIPDNIIALEIAKNLGNPIMSASLKYNDDEMLEYPTDPFEIYETYGKLVDMVIDGGPGGNVPSTVIDCTVSPPLLVREGAGDVSDLVF